jgi:hypothetical protein
MEPRFSLQSVNGRVKTVQETVVSPSKEIPKFAPQYNEKFDVRVGFGVKRRGQKKKKKILLWALAQWEARHCAGYEYIT